MIRGFWGKKLGMTQIFSESKVVPVTVVDVSHWLVVGSKTEERDGYHAVVVGRVRKRFEDKEFSADWLKNLKQYFSVIKEVKSKDTAEVTVGQPVNFHEAFEAGVSVDVRGTTKGCGFAGVVKRHGFTGGRASHGDKMGNRPGSIGFLCKCGKVIKGKKLPGHMGTTRKTIQGIKLVDVKKDAQIVLLKGAVPGKAGSMVFVQSGVKA